MNYSRGPMSQPPSMHSDYDPRSGSGPANKRPRIDNFNDGHWASAPTDRHGGGGGGGNGYAPAPQWRGNPNDHQSMGNPNGMVDDSLDETLTAARHGVSPFFQTATDEEMRGLSRTLRSLPK